MRVFVLGQVPAGRVQVHPVGQRQLQNGQVGLDLGLGPGRAVQVELDTEVQFRLVVPTDEVEALVQVHPEPEVQVPFGGQGGLHVAPQGQQWDAQVEGEGARGQLDRVPDVEVELEGHRVENVQRFVAVRVEELVGDGDVRANLAEHVVDHVVDERNEPVQVQVGLGDLVRQRLQEVEPEVLDEAGHRVVGEGVTDERKFETEQLAAQEALNLLKDRVQPLDH